MTAAHAGGLFHAVEQDRERLGEFLEWVDALGGPADAIQMVRESIGKWKARVQFDFGIFLRSTGQLIGGVGVHSMSWEHERCELGFWLAGEQESKGLARESVVALDKVLFSLGFHRIEIHCAADNARAIALARGAGFRLEAQLREAILAPEGFVNVLIFGRLSSDPEVGTTR